jgi:hypothetical protein
MVLLRRKSPQNFPGNTGTGRAGQDSRPLPKTTLTANQTTRLPLLAQKDIESNCCQRGEGLWIRIRIISGDYGREVVIKDKQQYSFEAQVQGTVSWKYYHLCSQYKKKASNELLHINNLDYYQYNRSGQRCL